MKIIYVDDEMPARINFRLTAEPLDSVDELYLFGNAQSALDWLQDHDADVAFLDLELGGGVGGMELALLVDRAGAGVSTGEAIACLWPDRPNDHNTATLMRMTAMRLMEALRKAGAAQIIGVGNREKWIVRDLVDCDLYRILDGDSQAMRRYSGEYLREYAWAEQTNARLAQITGWYGAEE